MKTFILIFLCIFLLSGCSFNLYNDNFSSKYIDDFKESGVSASPEFILKHAHEINKYSYKDFVEIDGRFIKKEDYEKEKEEMNEE